MPIFKNTVALEACPAKTAESISYGATFAVLALLLANYYTGIGRAEQESQPLANTPAGSILDQAAPLISAQVAANQNSETTLMTASLTQADPSTQDSLFTTSPPAWHSTLSPYQQFDSKAQQRTFSVAAWNHKESQISQPFDGYLERPALSLSLIDIDYAFDIQDFIEPDPVKELANTDVTKSQLIREITVRGAAADRLTARPSNSQRPQIPRP